MTAVLNSPMIYGELGKGSVDSRVSKICFFKLRELRLQEYSGVKRCFMDSDKEFALRD